MISAILLSGGSGKRMQASLPKQYLPLHGKPIILHALEALLTYSDWSEIAIVCEKEFEPLFMPYKNKATIRFASPGKERQDSVFSGLSQLSSAANLVCVHDGARPLLLEKDLTALIEQGKKTGVAALAVPVATTIKAVDKNLTVQKTLDRSNLFAIQTPQILPYNLLKEGYKQASAQGRILTDDISLAEELGHPGTLVIGSESNIKITTSEDLLLAEVLLRRLHG